MENNSMRQLKFWSWFVILGLLSFLFWNYCQDLYQAARLDVASGPLGLASFILLGIVLSLGLMIFKRFKEAGLLMLVVPVTYVLVFGNRPEITISALIFLVLAFLGWSLARKDVSKSLKIQPSRTSRLVLWPTMTGMALMIAVASIGSLNINEIKDAPIATQEQIREVIAGFNLKEFNELEERERENVIEAVSYRVNIFLKSYSESFAQFLPQAFALALFVILLGLNWFLVFGISFLCVLAFYILRRTGFVSIEKIQVEAERVRM